MAFFTASEKATTILLWMSERPFTRVDLAVYLEEIDFIDPDDDRTDRAAVHAGYLIDAARRDGLIFWHIAAYHADRKRMSAEIALRARLANRVSNAPEPGFDASAITLPMVMKFAVGF